MTHWGWYWKIKRKHVPKASCSAFQTIDSFELFKNKQLVEWSMNKVAIEMPRYDLKATLHEDHYSVIFDNGSYKIPLEKKPCNYGGYYYFFHCPSCDRRMRILYCIKGLFLCRKCLNLGYYTQRLRPTQRCIMMGIKIKEKLEKRAGSLERKPPWMKKRTFEKLKERYAEYHDVKYDKALLKELIGSANQSNID